MTSMTVALVGVLIAFIAGSAYRVAKRATAELAKAQLEVRTLRDARSAAWHRADVWIVVLAVFLLLVVVATLPHAS